MIGIKIFTKPKSKGKTGGGPTGGGVGSSAGVADEARKAAFAEKAAYADKSGQSELSTYADKAGYTTRSGFADKAEDLTEDSPIRKSFISRLIDDIAEGVITFLKGIKFGDGETSIDEKGLARLTAVQSQLGYGVGEYVEGVSGAVLAERNGQTYLEVDKAYIRGKAVFESLDVMKTEYSYGNRIAGKGGIRVKRVEELPDAYRCYFLNEQDGLKINNPFIVNDRAIVKESNIKAGTSEHKGNHFLWRTVVAVGENYVDLSKSDCLEGSDKPIAGDNLCQLGYRGNDRPDRQCAIMERTVGEDVPAYVMLQGINDFTLEGKDVLSYGWDASKGRAFLKTYGDAYIGDRELNQFIRYTPEGGLEVNARFLRLVTQGQTSDIGEGMKRAGINIADGTIEATSDHFYIVNPKTGQRVAAIDADGKISAPLIDAEKILTGEINANNAIINNATLTGFVKKRAFHVTEENFASVTTKGTGSSGLDFYTIDFTKTGTFVVFDYLPKSKTVIVMPSITRNYGNYLKRADMDYISKKLEIAGNRVIVVNNAKKNFANISGCLSYKGGGADLDVDVIDHRFSQDNRPAEDTHYTTAPIPPGMVAIMDCEIDTWEPYAYGDTKMYMYWKLRTVMPSI